MKMKQFNLIILSFLLAPPSWSRTYDLYRPDYFKGAFCSAIGGSCAAESDLIAGLFQNPASLITGKEDWDFDGDFVAKSNLEPGMKSGNDISETTAVAGFGYSWQKFGTGIAFLYKKDSVTSDLTIFDDSASSQKTKTQTHASSLQVRVPFSHVITPELSLGMAVSVLNHKQNLNIESAASGVTPTGDTKIGLSFGAMVSLPPNFQFGSWVRLPRTLSEHLEFKSTVPGTTVNYSEDLDLHYPWIWANGLKWTATNSATFFLEGDLVGLTEKGFLLSYDSLSASVGEKGLTEKGRSITFEPHAGARFNVSGDGKLKLHLGSFYEPSRSQGFSGRTHYSGGISYILGHDFCEILAGVDLAKNLSQILFTIR